MEHHPQPQPRELHRGSKTALPWPRMYQQVTGMVVMFTIVIWVRSTVEWLLSRIPSYGATGASLSKLIRRTRCGVLVDDLKIRSGLVWRILLGLEILLLRGHLWIAGNRLQRWWMVAGRMAMWIVIDVTTGNNIGGYGSIWLTGTF